MEQRKNKNGGYIFAGIVAIILAALFFGLDNVIFGTSLGDHLAYHGDVWVGVILAIVGIVFFAIFFGEENS